MQPLSFFSRIEPVKHEIEIVNVGCIVVIECLRFDILWPYDEKVAHEGGLLHQDPSRGADLPSGTSGSS